MRATVLWTGGKDCTLALCRAREAGAHVVSLATFFPAGDPEAFKAHPIEQLRRIAERANLEHDLIPVSEPYRDGYVKGLADLCDRRKIDTVVTGDIDLVDGFPSWIQECIDGLGLEAFMPLWNCPREGALREILARGIAARISWINSPLIPQAWLGRTIDAGFIRDIMFLAKSAPIDICGENGEYHTMVDAIPGHEEVS